MAHQFFVGSMVQPLQGGPANDGFLWLTSLHDWLTIEPLGLWEINRTGEWGEHKPTNPMDPNTF